MAESDCTVDQWLTCRAQESSGQTMEGGSVSETECAWRKVGDGNLSSRSGARYAAGGRDA
jgi:hypothetical protein